MVSGANPDGPTNHTGSNVGAVVYNNDEKNNGENNEND